MSAFHFDLDESRVQSPRPQTPEPDSRQGRRNAAAGVQLLDDKGVIGEKFERCLMHIFAKYCTPAPSRPPTTIAHTKQRSPLGTTLLSPPQDAYFTSTAFDKWATDTNGAPFSEETKEEMKGFLDVSENGNLTFKGFLQIYQLQTENDEEDTWRDLSNHGFDRALNLVTSRREEIDVDDMDRKQVQSPALVEGASA